MLDLTGNLLERLPESLLVLAKKRILRALFLHGNEALGLPAEVLGPRREECKGYGTGRKVPARPLEILQSYFRRRRPESRLVYHHGVTGESLSSGPNHLIPASRHASPTLSPWP
jgi:hypothetical protein